MKVFETYASYYDLLYSDKNYGEETDFLINLLKKYSPNATQLLELGCGTGAHAIEFAKKGYKVDGIDQSKKMLGGFKQHIANLKAEQQNRLMFSCQDIRSFSMKKQYDAAISVFHVVSYITDNKDLLKVFKTIFKHLKKGIFIFDCWYGPAVLACKPETRVKKIKSNTTNIIRIAEPVLKEDDNIVDVYYHTIIKDDSINKVEETSETHSMRYFFTPEIKFYLTQAGFKLLEHGEWLTGAAPSVNTWSVYFVAEKL